MYEEDYDNMPDLVMNIKLHEGGVTYVPGELFPPDVVEYDRLVFILAKEWATPGDWQLLPEPLFTDVMVKRD